MEWLRTASQALALLLVLGARASAQALPDDPFPHDEADDPIGVDADAAELDALAKQRASASAARAAPAIDMSFGPVPPIASARTGEVVTAVPAAREAAHRAHVELSPGLARVRVEVELESTADKPCEVRYRLAVPHGAQLVGLRACNAAGCRQAQVERQGASQSAYDAAVLARAEREPSSPRRNDKGPLPVAHARLDSDAHAVIVRAAPVVKGAPLSIELRYEADAPMHGGTVRFALPARGMDPRAAPTEVELDAPGLLNARVLGQPATAALIGDPWIELAMTAQAPAGSTGHQLRRMTCGGVPCVHARAWAGPRAQAARDIVVALDVSPSTEGPARGRLMAALVALLEAAPPGSRIRALAFAARSQALIETPLEPGSVSIAPFARAIDEAELGAATRFEAVWAQTRSWLERNRQAAPLIVLLGDGGLTVGAKSAFASAKRAGVEVSTVNVADRTTVSALRAGVQLTGGVAIDVGANAERAAREVGAELLREQLAALFSPSLGRVQVAGLRALDASAERSPKTIALELGLLRAGEALVLRSAASPTPALRVGAARSRSVTSDALLGGAQALVAVDARDLAYGALSAQHWPEPRPHGPRGSCDRRGPSRVRSGVSSDAAPLALAEERACAVSKPSAASASLGRGMPSDPLLEMLRQRVLPLARGCFRRDRAGRSEYERRAVFVFALAEREVVSAEIEGRIPEPLRECLMGAVDALDVPRFTGMVKVRYPLVTESVEVSPQVELTKVAAGAVDALLAEKPAARDLPLDRPRSAPSRRLP
jgi:hypothetical protein